MKTTPNLGLRKPEQTDFYNVDDFNYNADVIDQELTEAKATAQQANQTANQTASDLAAHLNDFAQVWSNRIVEMGSNANGTYVRWENGLQICWAGRSVINWPEQTTANAGSTYYASEFTWTFPASFIDTNIVITANPGYVGTDGSWGITTMYYDSVTTISVRLRLWTTHSRPNISNGTAVAIGRWK